MIKTIITDVNGILIPVGQNDIDIEIINKLKKLQTSGMHIILCTANPYYFIDDFIQQINSSDQQVINSGREIFLPKTNEVINLKLGSMKQDGAQWVIDHLNISKSEILGVGDSSGDIDFMSLCDYVATVEDADSKVIEFVKNKGDNGYIAPPVSENGFIDIINNFFYETTS